MRREVIEWFDVTERVPDSDATVMIHIASVASEPVWLGWHEGKKWYAVDATEQPHVDRWAEMPTGEATP